MPVRKRADLCAESVSVGMATDVNGKGTARRGEAKRSVGVPGVKKERARLPAGAFVCESARAQARGETGSRHADLREYALTHIQSDLLSSLASIKTATGTQNA